MLAEPPRGPETSAEGRLLLRLGPISVPIDHESPLVEDPAQYAGVRHDAPRFDTHALGEDLNLVVIQPDFSALQQEPDVVTDKIMRAVYLGHDSAGTPVYIYAQGTESLIDLVARFFMDEGSVGRLGSTYHCCLNGPFVIDSIGESVKSVRTVPGLRSTVVAEWHNLDESVSVVALRVQDEPVGWQTPTSGSAVFRIDMSEIEDPTELSIVVVAYDSLGNELGRT